MTHNACSVQNLPHMRFKNRKPQKWHPVFDCPRVRGISIPLTVNARGLWGRDFVNTRKLPRTRATFMRSGLCALLPLTKRSQCHCLSWLLGNRRLFDSRTRYTFEIRHFPRFFHELSVPKGNATYNTENKHGRRVLSKRKRQDVPNLTDSQRV